MAMFTDIRNSWVTEGISSDLIGSGKRPKTPAEFVQCPVADAIKWKPFIVVRVEYIKGDPEILRLISPWVNRRSKLPVVKSRGYGVDEGAAYFDYDEQIAGGAGYSIISAAFVSKAFVQARKDLAELPNNSPIRPKSSFIVVQLGDQVRIYSKDQIPSSIRPAFDDIDNRSSFFHVTRMEHD
jgi:hypothetical protein